MYLNCTPDTAVCPNEKHPPKPWAPNCCNEWQRKIEDLADKVTRLNVSGLVAEPDYTDMEDITVDMEATSVTNAG